MATYILDASAFLAGVSLCFQGEMIVPSSVREELKYGAGRRRLEETITRGCRVVSPSPEAVADVQERMMGADQGLSPADVDVVAVAMENNGTVVSDDYGIQNTCLALGIPFQPLAEAGVGERWNWGLRCTGCGRWVRESSACPVCGSPVKRKRI